MSFGSFCTTVWWLRVHTDKCWHIFCQDHEIMVMKTLLLLLHVSMAALIKLSFPWQISLSHCAFMPTYTLMCWMMLVVECKYSLDVQVTSSECMGVLIKHFRNLYKVEIRDNFYCCCDNPNMTLCSESIPDEDGKCFDSYTYMYIVFLWSLFFFLSMSQTVPITRHALFPKLNNLRLITVLHLVNLYFTFFWWR